MCRWLGVLLFICQWGNRFLLRGGSCGLFSWFSFWSKSPLGFGLAFHHKPRRTLVLWFRLTLLRPAACDFIEAWVCRWLGVLLFIRQWGNRFLLCGRGADFLVGLASGGASPLGFGLAFHHKPRRTLVLWFRLTPVAWRLRDLTGNWVCRWLGVLLFIRQWGNRFLLCGGRCGLSSSYSFKGCVSLPCFA